MYQKLLLTIVGFMDGNYSTTYKIVSMIPGTAIFLVVSPFIIFFPSKFLGHFFPFSVSLFCERMIIIFASVISLTLMNWALYELWVKGGGTPAPITPTKKLVTTGPYKIIRNPIELGTALFFLVIGIWFDSLTTGLFCMFFGIILGMGYCKIIEEKELLLRFGERYDRYKKTTPCILPYFRRID